MFAKIPLTQNQVALVDAEDFDYLNQWKWFASFDKCTNSFYALRTDCSDGKKKTISMHRFILNITDSKIRVDHIDHITLNNLKSNLRIATRSQNGANRKSKKNGTSQYLGVCWHKTRNKWVAQITKDKKPFHIGDFKNEIEAAKKYDEWAIKLHGDFANLNKIAV